MSDETKAIVVQATTSKAILTREALRAEVEQRALLAEYIRGQMAEKTDYGKIPGTDKPTLLKPGAEKLVDLFRCTPKFHLVKIEEDHQRGFFNYVFRVRLYQRDADAVLAEGFGSANSMEGRYRWREAQRKCTKCGKATIFASKIDPGFYCWAKKGGCGAKFDASDTAITSQQAGRVENDDVATLANTILKMAKKRALVDGAIALARCSDMFTQDVEDLSEQQPEEPPRPPHQEARRTTQQSPAGPVTKASVRQAVTAAKEAVKKPPLIVDVQPGESEADATARTAVEVTHYEVTHSTKPSVWERMGIAASEHGVTQVQLGAIIKGFSKKTKTAELDEEDLAIAVARIKQLAEARDTVKASVGLEPATFLKVFHE